MLPVSVALLVITCSAPPAFAAAVSKKQLLEMAHAKIDAAAQIALLKANGLDFEATPEALIELKAGGVLPTVLNAIARLSATKQGDSPANYFERAQGAYRDESYEHAVGILEEGLTKAPDDGRGRLLMAASLLKLGKRDDAAQLLAGIKSTGGSRDPRLVAAAERLLARYDQQQDLQTDLLAALQSLHFTRAVDVLAESSASPRTKQIIGSYLNMYRGEYAVARADLEALPTEQPADKRAKETLLTETSTREAAFRKQLALVQDFHYNGLAASVWGSRNLEPDQTPGFLEDYSSAVLGLARLSPLSNEVLDYLFHLAVVGGDYATIEDVGDKILAAKGEIRIPGCARDRYFFFVIDQEHARLRTEESTRPFVARYGLVRWTGKVRDSTQTRTFGELEMLDLPFRDVISLSQKYEPVVGEVHGLMLFNSQFLRIKPRGMVPSWSMMQIVEGLYGGKATKASSASLAKFILHVIADPGIKSKLMDPEKEEGPSNSAVALLAVASVAASASAVAGVDPAVSADMSSSLLQAYQHLAASRAAASEVIKTDSLWSTAVQEAMHFADDAFEEVEELLGTTSG